MPKPSNVSDPTHGRPDDPFGVTIPHTVAVNPASAINLYVTFTASGDTVSWTFKDATGLTVSTSSTAGYHFETALAAAAAALVSASHDPLTVLNVLGASGGPVSQCQLGDALR
jgi:hypothetical protein